MGRQKTNERIGDFVLNNEAEYDWNVYPHAPDGRGGRKKFKIKCRFRHITRDRRVEVLQEHRERVEALRQAKGSDDELDLQKGVNSFEVELLREALVSFSGVVDAQGAPVPCTDETKDLLLANDWARSALLDGYIKSLSGRDDTGN